MDFDFLGLDLARPEVLLPFVVGVGVVLSIGVVAWLIRAAYRGAMRRTIRTMLQAKEGVKALIGGIVESRNRIVAASAVQARERFIEDIHSPERLGFIDLDSRARIIVDELDSMAMPKSLIPIAEALADIAFLIERNVDAVHGGKGVEALAALEAIDVERLTGAMATVEERLEQLAVLYGITEVAVYKGGLYV